MNALANLTLSVGEMIVHEATWRVLEVKPSGEVHAQYRYRRKVSHLICCSVLLRQV